MPVGIKNLQQSQAEIQDSLDSDIDTAFNNYRQEMAEETKAPAW